MLRVMQVRGLVRAAAMIVVALGGLIAAQHPAKAQSHDDESAYRALIYTPVAGLPPLAPPTDSLGHRQGSGVTLLGRLGHMSRDGGALSISTYGVGVEVPRGRIRLGATLGYLTASCTGEWVGDPDCSGDIMLGGSVRTLIAQKPLTGDQPPPRKGKRSTAPTNEGMFLFGFEGSAGYSPRQGATTLALEASMPTALALQSGTVRIMPFISPGVGYRRIANDQYPDEEVATAHAGIELVIGGGLGLEFGASGVGANVGFTRVLKGPGGTTQLGIGMTWQGLNFIPRRGGQPSSAGSPAPAMLVVRSAARPIVRRARARDRRLSRTDARAPRRADSGRQYARRRRARSTARDRRRAVHHRGGDRVVERDHRVVRHAAKHVVQREDLRPIRVSSTCAASSCNAAIAAWSWYAADRASRQRLRR